MLVIDGYNVLFARLQGRIETARLVEDRDALVAEIGDYCRRRRLKARIYFDPSRGLSPSGTVRRPPVEVVYLPAGISADQAIQDLVKGKDDRTAYRVVSSDREVAGAAAKRKFETVSAEDFLKDLDRGVGAGEKPSKKTVGISAAEADVWLKEFGLEGGGEETGRDS